MKTSVFVKSFLSLVSLVASTGCATAPPYNPFKVDRGEFLSRVKTIALAPLEMPALGEDPEAIKSEFERLIDAQLREAGFTTVPASRYAALRSEVGQRLGGVYDPISGKADDSKLEALAEQVHQELSEDANVDAILYPSIIPVGAKWGGNEARWDGTPESTTGREGLLGFLLAPRAR